MGSVARLFSALNVVGYVAGAVSALAMLAASPVTAAISSGGAHRLALVIGNSNYSSLAKLDSPKNDATAMARVLRSLNFEVILKTDLDLHAMQKAVKDFGKKLKKGGVGLFYYSGHGLQVDLTNYLIPIGGAVKFAEDIPNSSIEANSILRMFRSAKTRFNFVILDACRNNDLERRDKRRVTGLAEMDAPKGTLISYATGPNKIASDGVNGRSLFTNELLKVIALPGLQVEQILKRVRQRVHEVSLGDQLPVEYTSLTEDFYFRPKPRIASTAPAPGPSRVIVEPINERFEAMRSLVIHSGPSNNAGAVGRVAARERVRAIGRVKDRDWVKIVTRGGIQGFVPDYLLRPPFLWKEIRHKGTFEVLEAASLHQQPRSSSPSVSKLEPGQSVAATHRIKGMNWLRVRTRAGKAGFVHKSVLRQPFTFEVASYSGRFETTSNVKLLAQPRIGSRQVASLTAREKLSAIGKVRNRNWLKVRRADGAEGFVPETLLSIPFDWRERVLKPKPYKTVASATLRKEPRSTARLVASLAPSQVITVVAKIEGREWLKVKLQDKREGYVLENLLQRVVARLAARVFKSGENFRDCPTCPMMVALPTGEFVMGSKDGTRDQRPTRKVTFTRMFAIGKFEITFKEWGVCVSGGGCRNVPSDNGWGRADRPVINISWDDAQEYARWLTKKTGERYHLLSEAQWEYAARAGSQTKYAWADTIGDNRANCDGCGSRWDGKSTGTVGSFKPNAFGLHDMHGNVWEWTEDCWHRNYRRAPKDGRAWTTGSCKQSVLRGGSFRESAEFSSSTRRARYPSAPRDNFGFRIARIIN